MAGPVSAEQYYNNADSHGNYQFITLSEVVNTVELLKQDDDSVLSTTKRTQILAHAKRALRDFSRDTSSNVLSFGITVGPDLTVVMPQNYVNWVAIYVVVMDNVTGSRRLQPLQLNRNINTAIDYLQDNDYNILFDESGDILTADGSNAYASPYRRYHYCCRGGQSLLDTSLLSQWGEFNEDPNRGCFIFSHNLIDQDIVIDYIDDGLSAQDIDGSTIRVHKYLEKALIDNIYYNCIRWKKNVAANEKYRAANEMKASRHNAKIAMMDFNFMEVERLMRQTTMLLP